MTVNVEMTDDDFMEFMDWKKNKRLYELKEINLYGELGKRHERLASLALNALAETENEYTIKDQETASELIITASEVFS